MAQKRNREDIERRLFELSIGPLRLLDTILDKAGERGAADLLREVLLDWRAYPSKSKFSAKVLKEFSVKLGEIEAASLRAKEDQAASLVSEVGMKLKRWIQGGG